MSNSNTINVQYPKSKNRFVDLVIGITCLASFLAEVWTLELVIGFLILFDINI